MLWKVDLLLVSLVPMLELSEDVLSDAARVSVESSMAVVLDSSSLQPKISWRINIKTKENRLKLRTI